MDARTLAEIDAMVRRNLEADPRYYDAFAISREVADAYGRGYADALDAEYGTEDDRPAWHPDPFAGQPEQSAPVYSVMDDETHRLRRMSQLEIEELRQGGGA